MSASADVETEKLTGVTLIPSRAVFEHNGRIVAWVRHGKEFEMRKIEVGKKGDGQTQVLSGLQAGDTVALEEPVVATPGRGGA
jgi:multidrug efflux pump subunit AcrA (membrane-fusion protein)